MRRRAQCPAAAMVGVGRETVMRGSGHQKFSFVRRPRPLAGGASINADQQLQFLQLHGLQRQPAPLAQPQLSVLRSSTLVISILLFALLLSERITI
jgi:hypothetical protein